LGANVPDGLVAFAEEVADAAGAIIRRYFRSGVEIVDKPDLSPVTIADREAEAAIRNLVAARYPGHGIVGEEHGADRADAEFVWVVDPIDGTKGFTCGRPLFGTLIALCREGRPIVGIVDHPALGERWVGAIGRPTTFCGKPARTRSGRRVANAVLLASSPHMFKGNQQTAFDRVRLACRFVQYGSDCYHYGIVASGNGDIVIEASMGIYDYLAAVPVIEGAGGVISDWNGRPLTIASGDTVLAAGDLALHDEARALLDA
jgi:inositol-phosphate phosphatase / L-galactose 1-phosphate phosphatase / histidinol-phosphatase